MEAFSLQELPNDSFCWLVPPSLRVGETQGHLNQPSRSFPPYHLAGAGTAGEGRCTHVCSRTHKCSAVGEGDRPQGTARDLLASLSSIPGGLPGLPDVLHRHSISHSLVTIHDTLPLEYSPSAPRDRFSHRVLATAPSSISWFTKLRSHISSLRHLLWPECLCPHPLRAICVLKS